MSSPSPLLRVAWLGALLLIWAPRPARADLFSPGELAKAHAALEGIKNCTACHPAGGQLSQETCLDCHTELGPVAKGVGFHGKIPPDKRACEVCHHDHQGRAYQMVVWPGGLKAFDHKKTGWPLQGKHFELECKACHEPRLIFSGAIQQLLAHQPGRETYLGLKTECAPCHFDDHRGQVGIECAACHDEKVWKPASGFDHRDTAYPLEGKHQSVKCDKCHPKLHDDEPRARFPAPVSESFLKFAPLEFRLCTDCHRDPHEGRFGARCASCHTVVSWTAIRNAKEERAFHEKTRYPLKGAHLEVACKDCHGPFPGQPARFKKMQFANCTDCHLDAHLGQLEKARGAKVLDCADCHGLDGFSPARYSLEDHQKTRYPLEGGHQVVACAACHPRSAGLGITMTRVIQADRQRRTRAEMFSLAAYDLKKPLAACESCHGDVHAGQFKRRAGSCAGCHEVSSWRQVKFDHDHDSRYPLTGKHAKVACSGCHTPPALGKPVSYAPLPLDCASCHADVHVGQLSPAPGKPTACEKCHRTSDWKALDFVHQPPFTAYLLEGKHAAAKCAACHLKLKLGAQVETVRYKPLPTTCEGCHRDFHQGAFKDFIP